jgi:hypothetical protein
MHLSNDVDITGRPADLTYKGDLNDTREDFTAIPDHEVKGARQHLRGLLGREPKQHMSNQFNNVPLPGMENF